MNNPLLEIGAALPAFDKISADHVGPAVEALLAQALQALEAAVGPDAPNDYDGLSAVLDVALERLGTAWSAVEHLNAVADTSALRAAYNAGLAPITEFQTRIAGDERLFAKYKAVAAGPSAAAPARQRELGNAIRDFTLAGAELRGEAKLRNAQLRERLAELAQQYSEHVLDATGAFTLDVADPARLAGLPEDVLSATRAAAVAAGVDGHRLSLHAPVYIPAIQYLEDRALRQALHSAYTSRASELGPAALDNSGVMTELLQLRQEQAQLLGYANYAALSMVPKMADSATEVIDFIRDLAQRARPHAQRELDQLRDFASAQLGIDDPQAWDLAFVSEKLREAQYSYSALEVQAYFTLPRVLDGLLRIVETLFDVSISEDSAPVWHDSVRVLRITRRDPAHGQPAKLLARVYLDLHARPGKRPGAWMAPARSRWLRPDGGGEVQTPVAHLVCNFASPQGERPALLTHADVLTLFHEWGHGLHHLLTQVDELGVSGVNGVEWDAVELPSQFMENFGWEWDVLRRMTAHVDTGEPLPRALFDKMLAARNYLVGLGLLRQMEYALFDMRLYAEPAQATGINALAEEVRAEVSVLPPPAINRFQHAFAHIFAGGYAAGYYSYKWAEVLSSDAWSAFEQAGALDAETGRRYRREILETGGSRPALDSFRAFRGRAPSADALLRRAGLA